MPRPPALKKRTGQPLVCVRELSSRNRWCLFQNPLDKGTALQQSGRQRFVLFFLKSKGDWTCKGGPTLCIVCSQPVSQYLHSTSYVWKQVSYLTLPGLTDTELSLQGSTAKTRSHLPCVTSILLLCQIDPHFSNQFLWESTPHFTLCIASLGANSAGIVVCVSDFFELAPSSLVFSIHIPLSRASKNYLST